MLEISNEEYPDFTPSETLVSNDVKNIIEMVFDLILSFIVSFTGIFTNIIVIIVFAKQGFKDSVGISMTTIAVWDLLKCLLGFMRRMRGPISLWFPAQAESWSNISLAIISYLVSISTYVTSTLAAYVAIERCICITVPHKIKLLVTRRITFTACLALSIIIFSWFAVIFAIYDIYWVYSPKHNQTIAMFRFSAFATNNTVLFVYYNWSGILWPLVSLLVIVVSTIIISYKLRQMSAFRSEQLTLSDFQIKATPKPAQYRTVLKQDSSNSIMGQSSRKLSRRDQRVVKMLLVIIAIYIVCLAPREAIYIAKPFEEEFYFLRKYHNLFSTVVYIELFFDFVNGTVNLFVFLAMSTSFRATFLDAFPFCKRIVRAKSQCSAQQTQSSTA